TLLVVMITTPLNIVFGLVGAFALTKFQFRGKGFFFTLIDLPMAVSPVVVGFAFVLLYGKYGFFADVVNTIGVDVIFGIPGIVLVTHFVTLPLVIRELIPLMQAQGTEEEEAAISLGASGWQMFWRVTFPNIRWALLYGAILAIARGIGEFGAVSVVSGHIEGKTNTMPLLIEILYNEYAFEAAFALATLMSLFSIFTIIVKRIIEIKITATKQRLQSEEDVA
ncbi:MAG: sulfate ABC transporter permease, partial [Bacilli bacterium]